MGCGHAVDGNVIFVVQILSSLHGNPTDNDVTMQDVYKVGLIVGGINWGYGYICCRSSMTCLQGHSVL